MKMANNMSKSVGNAVSIDTKYAVCWYGIY